MWLDVTNVEGMYQGLASEAENFRSLVAKREDETKTRHVLNAFDL
jgi:hypothetical protein